MQLTHSNSTKNVEPPVNGSPRVYMPTLNIVQHTQAERFKRYFRTHFGIPLFAIVRVRFGCVQARCARFIFFWCSRSVARLPSFFRRGQ